MKRIASKIKEGLPHKREKNLCDSPLVPLTGLEPVRCCHRGILSPLRLPISPQRRAKWNVYLL